MASNLKILVVDDSAIYRSLVQGCLREIPDVECVGTASDGREAIERARELRPDVVLLDVEMPVMNGVEAIPPMLELEPPPGIIMVSGLTTNGAEVTVKGLEAGAFDFVTKPQVKAGEDGFAALRQPLERVIAAYRESLRPHAAPAPAAAPTRRGKVPVIDVVAMGVSTGGPSALSEVIPNLPGDLCVPVIVVQHMPARFTSSLADSLDSKSKLRVMEASEGHVPAGGEVLVAPGGRHTLVAVRDSEPFIRFSDADPVNSFRPSVDVLFDSVAEAYSGRALCIVMTGMGSDGYRGACRLREAGGYCIAQDQASCAVYGMPRAVVEGGAADEVIALDGLAARIQEIARRR